MSKNKPGIDYCGKKKSPKGVCIREVNHPNDGPYDGHRDFTVTVARKVFGLDNG